MGMSPYFPHCIKNNKNSVLLKDKKSSTMWKVRVPLFAGHTSGKHFSEEMYRTEQRAYF